MMPRRQGCVQIGNAAASIPAAVRDAGIRHTLQRDFGGAGLRGQHTCNMGHVVMIAV
jgi:hypothetical protein